MIRLQTTVHFPPLPGLDMGVGRIHYYQGRYLLAHSHVTLVCLST